MYGACQLCLSALKAHILRPDIVQKALWALCVLGGDM